MTGADWWNCDRRLGVADRSTLASRLRAGAWRSVETSLPGGPFSRMHPERLVNDFAFRNSVALLYLLLPLVGCELLASPRLPRGAYDLVAVRPGRCGGESRGLRHEGHDDQVVGRRCKRPTRMPLIQRLRESKSGFRNWQLGSATRLLPAADRRGNKVDPRQVQESESHPDETVKARLMARCPAQQLGDL